MYQLTQNLNPAQIKHNREYTYVRKVGKEEGTGNIEEDKWMPGVNWNVQINIFLLGVAYIRNR